MDNKQLILKGMGKSKVRAIVKKWIIEQSNIFLAYGETIKIYGYTCVIGFGLPELGDDDDFSFSDLTEFLNNKI